MAHAVNHGQIHLSALSKAGVYLDRTAAGARQESRQRLLSLAAHCV